MTEHLMHSEKKREIGSACVERIIEVSPLFFKGVKMQGRFLNNRFPLSDLFFKNVYWSCRRWLH